MTTWMHGRGVLWYYGKPLQALAMPEEELATDYAMNTVIISPQWVITLLQCLLRRRWATLLKSGTDGAPHFLCFTLIENFF